jgi:membrane protein YqaA with SNARE-associated domain
MSALIEFSYIGLFVASLLAATILPLSSEVVLSALLLNGLSPMTLVITATIGNVLGSVLNYALGYWARFEVIQKVVNISDQAFSKAELRFKKYGLISLCFAWVPIIGDPLTLIAGVLRVHLAWFLILVTLGKLGRYLVISYLVLVNS